MWARPRPEKAVTTAGAREHVIKGEARCGKGQLTRELRASGRWRGHRSAPRPRVSLVTLAEVMAIVSLVSATTWLITGTSLSSFGATAWATTAALSSDEE